MKKVLIVALTALLLAGCSTPKKSTLACTQDNGAGATSTASFIFNGNALETAEIAGVIAIPEEQKEALDMIKAQQEELAKQIEQFDGVTLVYSLTETELSQTMTFDVAKLSDEALLQFGFTDEMKTDGKFNIDKIEKTYTNLGITCTRK